MPRFKYLLIFSPKSFPTCYSQSIYFVTDAVEVATFNFSTTPQRCNTNWMLLCTNSDRLFLVSWVTMEWFEHAKRKLVAQTSGVLRQNRFWWSGELCRHFQQRKMKRQRHWVLKDRNREPLLTRTKLTYDYVPFQFFFFFLKLLASPLQFQCEIKKKLTTPQGNKLQSSGKAATFMRIY
jgi:hypothetical protein